MKLFALYLDGDRQYIDLSIDIINDETLYDYGFSPTSLDNLFAAKNTVCFCGKNQFHQN